MINPGPHRSWLAPPTDATWPEPTDEANSFIRYRRLLWSWRRAMDAGWSDADFVEAIRTIDSAVSGVDGTGFVATPARWVDDLAGGGATSRVFAKDETANVGGSHKARHLMGLLLHLAVDAVADDVRLAIASCGNAALGAATVARAAGRPIDVFIPTWADATVASLLVDLGASIHVCERQPGELGDPCMLRFQEAVAAGALPFGVQATENRWTLDGGRTIGWELAEQLAASEQVAGDVLIQVGGGALLTSCAIGLIEGAELGPLPAPPKVWAVQAAGCAPFDRAWGSLSAVGSIDERLSDAEARADELMVPWHDPRSAATGILDDITYDWLGISRALLVTGGGSIVAGEADIEGANERVVRAGFNADHTGSAGYAGLLSAVRDGAVSPLGGAAVLITGVRRS